MQAVRLVVRVRATSARAVPAPRLRRTMASEFRATVLIAIRTATSVVPDLPILRPTLLLRVPIVLLPHNRQAVAAIAVAEAAVAPSAALALVAEAAVAHAPVVAASAADVSSLLVVKWQSNEVT